MKSNSYSIKLASWERGGGKERAGREGERGSERRNEREEEGGKERERERERERELSLIHI